jgi:uncharacterized membrane protein
MLTSKTWIVLIVVAAVATYATEHFGFSIVHSSALLVLVAVTAPGFYVAFFNLIPSDWMTFAVAFVVNVAYYGLIAWFVRRAQHVPGRA